VKLQDVLKSVEKCERREMGRGSVFVLCQIVERDMHSVYAFMGNLPATCLVVWRSRVQNEEARREDDGSGAILLSVREPRQRRRWALSQWPSFSMILFCCRIDCADPAVEYLGARKKSGASQ
jgi:hypothetical protein